MPNSENKISAARSRFIASPCARERESDDLLSPLRGSSTFNLRTPGLSWNLAPLRSMPCLPCLQARDVESAEHARKGRLHLGVDFAGGLVDRGEDEVLEHFDVAGFYSFRIDAHAEELLAAIHFSGYGSAARGGFDDGLLHLALHGLVLLFGFRHQVLEIESAHSQIWQLGNSVVGIRSSGSVFGNRFGPRTGFRLPDYQITQLPSPFTVCLYSRSRF